MMSGWQTLSLYFSIYSCLTFLELLKSQKSSFLIIPGLIGLREIKKKKKNKKIQEKIKIKNHWKHPKLVKQSLFKHFQQKLNFSLVFHWKFNPFAPCDPQFK